MSWTGQSWGTEQPRMAADLTGNGCADIVGFGVNGVWASLNHGDGTFAPPNMVLAGFGAHTGWTVERHPRMLADLTGDGRADIIGFFADGVWTALNRGDGTFGPMCHVIKDNLGYDSGWMVDRHPRLVTDLTGDGRADIIGFGQDGVWVALGNGDGTFSAPAELPNQGFCYDQGWRVDQHPRYVTDLNGNGAADIVGYGQDGIWTAMGNGDGTFQSAARVLPDEFNSDKGWHGGKTPRMTGDLTSSGHADLVGFGDDHVWTAVGNGNGGFGAPSPIIPGLGYDEGWRVDRHPRLTADVTGDGRDDIIGFFDDAVWVAVSGGPGLQQAVDDFCFNKGWRVNEHPRQLADLTGDGKADIIGFGDAGVYVSRSNGDGSFQAAALVLPDFGLHAGPVVASITVDFHTLDDDLNEDTLLHVFVKNRSSDSWRGGGATTFENNLQSFNDHQDDWFSRNPYLGFKTNANTGEFDNDSTQTVTLQLRSQPIPFEELELPEVHVHILADTSDTWKFHYTLTITLDDGTVLPPYDSNVDGVAGIILDQNHRNYYGICREFAALPEHPTPDTDAKLSYVTIEFNMDGNDADDVSKLNIHIVNRINATESRDILVANDIAGQGFAGTAYYRNDDLPIASHEIYLREMVLPIVYINADCTDTWAFDYRVTLYFGEEPYGQPYSWTTSGIVLDQDHHKHMGVYSGRPFPRMLYPNAPLSSDGEDRSKAVSLGFVAQKLNEVFNSRQAKGALYPLLKVLVSSSAVPGEQIPPTYLDLRRIKNDPPPPDGQPLDPWYKMPVTWSHSISELKWANWSFADVSAGFHVNDLNVESIAITVNPEDDQTPITLAVTFETAGPVEVTGAHDIDITKFDVTMRLTLRFGTAHSPWSAVGTGAVDLFGWVDDIENINAIPTGKYLAILPVYRMQGTFLGQPIDEETVDPDDFRTALIEQVVKVHFEVDGLGSWVFRRMIRDGIYGGISSKTASPWDRVTLRDSVNAAVTSFLIGHVVASGTSELVPYPAPSILSSVDVTNGTLILSFIHPYDWYRNVAPPDWSTKADAGRLSHIDHIVVLMQENRSFDHMLGYLSLPVEKGGMGRTDIDGLRGHESNPYQGRTCVSFPLAPGDTIFSPGPPNDPEMVALQINGGKMDGFVQAQAEECGPETAHRVMGYHTAANVPTYDSLARDFSVGHRWFASHPGPTFPNRFYELSGHPNIDPWGAWEYTNGSPIVASISETILDHLSNAEVSWRTFEHYFSFVRRLEKYTFDSEHVVSYDDPVQGFKALAASGNLPAVSFIEPHYVDYPPDSFCDEPPSDIRNSQRFIRDLVNAVVAGPDWDSTLLLIVYDEHGGFFDHVPPPNAVAVAPGMLPTTGVRVPSFVVTPWMKAGSVFGSDELHFDHTSIMKTIARRFLSNDFPYLGARYAAAHDLSEVLEDHKRADQFRPFIPYTLMYGASGMGLAVQGDSVAPGAPLWEYPRTPFEAQQFRFEDAGNGFVRIRTHAGLYVTANGNAPADPTPVVLTQEPRITGVEQALRQHFRLMSTAIDVLHPNEYTVSCAAHPGKVLQPVNESGSSSLGVGVVLAAPSHQHPTQTANPWIVTSPLMPTAGPTHV